MICPECNYENLQQADVCISCGADIFHKEDQVGGGQPNKRSLLRLSFLSLVLIVTAVAAKQTFVFDEATEIAVNVLISLGVVLLVVPNVDYLSTRFRKSTFFLSVVLVVSGIFLPIICASDLCIVVRFVFIAVGLIAFSFVIINKLMPGSGLVAFAVKSILLVLLAMPIFYIFEEVKPGVVCCAAYSKNEQAKSSLLNLMVSMESYYAKHDSFPDSISSLEKGEYGFKPSPDVVLLITDLSGDCWRAVASHSQGDKLFYWDSCKGGVVTSEFAGDISK